jgi:hypothetical protein
VPVPRALMQRQGEVRRLIKAVHRRVEDRVAVENREPERTAIARPVSDLPVGKYRPRGDNA